MPNAKQKSSRGAISPPLPLPTHFTLLPSLLPNRALSPLLYVLINEIPVYLTLSPTHAPHLSLLPLLLALSPIAPVHLIRQIPAKAVSLTLDGVAPFEDLWLPLSDARDLCASLGLGPAFWDEGGRGMMGNGVMHAVSWEEEGQVCHNWIPSHAAIAASAYSLETLLSMPFPGVEIISEDKYIATRIDASRRAKILGQEFENPSKIREGLWAQAWPLILRWSLSCAFDENELIGAEHGTNSLYIPRLKPSSSTNASVLDDIHRILPLLPSLANETFRPSYSPTLDDLSALVFRAPPSLTWRQIPRLAVLLTSYAFYVLRSTLRLLTPFRSSSTTLSSHKLSFVELKRKEPLARVNLGLVEIVGSVMVNLWTLAHQIAKLKEQSPALDGAPTVILQTPLHPPRGRQVPAQRSPRAQEPRQAGQANVTASDAIDRPSEDEMEVLERRRGGSPAPEDTAGPSNGSVSSPSNGIGPYSQESDVSRQEDDDGQSEDWSGSSAANVQTEDPRVVALEEVTKVMRSEDAKEWWMYYTLLGVIIAAVALGIGT